MSSVLLQVALCTAFAVNDASAEGYDLSTLPNYPGNDAIAAMLYFHCELTSLI